MVGVPAAEFWMGFPAGRSWANEQPQHLVRLDGYCIDRTEVTAARYAACVAAGRCTAAGTGASCNAGVAEHGTHPINCVVWAQARTYCQVQGGDLPSEAQWELAATGGDGREYPWSSVAPRDQLCWSGVNRRGTTCPVGAFPSGRSPHGAEDMAGNVWEWVLDGYRTYPNAVENNPVAPHSDDNRVGRGGGFDYGRAAAARARTRYWVAMTNRRDNSGFRCARGVQ